MYNRWRKQFLLAALLGFVILLGAGCAHTVSETLRQQADMTLSFAQLRANPDAYTDRTVILGGEILDTRLTQEGTVLEVLHKPLDRYERPRLVGHTEGRFMVRCERYLDPVIYKPEREITVAGRVLGRRQGTVGEVEYVYPLISCIELHLWSEPLQAFPYEPYPWWYWDPWYRMHPWHWRPHYP